MIAQTTVAQDNVVSSISETAAETQLLMSATVAELIALTHILRLSIAFQHMIEDMRTDAMELYSDGISEQDVQKQQAAVQKLIHARDAIVYGTGRVVE